MVTQTSLLDDDTREIGGWDEEGFRVGNRKTTRKCERFILKVWRTSCNWVLTFMLLISWNVEKLEAFELEKYGLKLIILNLLRCRRKGI